MDTNVANPQYDKMLNVFSSGGQVQKSRAAKAGTLSYSGDTTIKTNQLLVSDFEMINVNPKDLLHTGSILRADVYLRLRDNTYLLVAKENSSVFSDGTTAFQDDEVRSYFIKRNDYKKCFGFKVISNNPEVEVKSAEWMESAKRQAFDDLRSIDINNDLLRNANPIISNAIKFIESNPGLLMAIQPLHQLPGNPLRQAFCVAALSILVAQNAGWKSQNNLERLAIAALLHDIGIRDVPAELLDRPRKSWNFTERSQYESHCENSYNILKGFSFISEDILCVAIEHHENSLGLGYPKRIKEIKMHPFSRIVSVVVRFIEIASLNSVHDIPKTPLEVIHQIETIQGQPYSKEYYRCLKSIVNNGMYMKNAA